MDWIAKFCILSGAIVLVRFVACLRAGFLTGIVESIMYEFALIMFNEGGDVLKDDLVVCSECLRRMKLEDSIFSVVKLAALRACVSIRDLDAAKEFVSPLTISRVIVPLRGGAVLKSLLLDYFCRAGRVFLYHEQWEEARDAFVSVSENLGIIDD